MFPTLSVSRRFSIHGSDCFTIEKSAREADWYNDDVAMMEITKHVEGLLAMVRDTPGKIRISIFMDVDNR